MSAVRCDCPSCGGTDTIRYKEGDKFGKCFRCEKNHLVSKLNNQEDKPVATKQARGNTPSGPDIYEIAEFESGPIPERGISAEVCDYFGVKLKYDKDGYTAAHYYPYTNVNGEIEKYKQRTLPKSFRFIPDGLQSGQLFGQAFCDPSLHRRLVVTEGETDALAVAEASLRKYGKIYPVVAVSGASDIAALVKNIGFLRKFEEVILLLDNDEAGKKGQDKGASNLAKVIGYDRVRIGQLTHKDPVEVLCSFAQPGQLPTEAELQEGAKLLMDCVFNNTAYSPAGFLTGAAIWEAYKGHQAKAVIPYPEFMGGINQKLKGRRDGEIVLLISGSGCGKSTMAREIALDELDYQIEGRKIGIIALESSPAEEAEAFYKMVAEVDTTERDLTEEEALAAHERVFADERVIVLDHQGAVSDSSLMDKLEVLCLLGCKTLVLDHITIAVSENDSDKRGNEAIDAAMNQLLKIVKKFEANLLLISHLRKTGEGQSFEEGKMPTLDDIKGSGSIKQISFDIIAFARNTMAENEEEQSIVRLAVPKARKTGRTGPAGVCKFSRGRQRMEAFQMQEVDFEDT